MSTVKGEFKHESVQDKTSIVKYLNALSEGLQKGSLTFNNKDKDITLEPVGLIQLEVKVKRSESKTKINLKMGWKENHAQEDNGPFSIEPGA